MRFARTLLLVLVPLLLVSTALAGPPQRLIIQFDTALSQEQVQTFNEKIKFIIATDYTRLPHSTDLRWIIEVEPALNVTDLNRVTEAISKLDNVTYAEPDQLLQIFH